MPEWMRYDEQGKPSFIAKAQTIDYFDDESARLNADRAARLGA